MSIVFNHKYLSQNFIKLSMQHFTQKKGKNQCPKVKAAYYKICSKLICLSGPQFWELCLLSYYSSIQAITKKQRKCKLFCVNSNFWLVLINYHFQAYSWMQNSDKHPKYIPDWVHTCYTIPNQVNNLAPSWALQDIGFILTRC